jgi:hypothetical protein
LGSQTLFGMDIPLQFGTNTFSLAPKTLEI